VASLIRRRLSGRACRLIAIGGLVVLSMDRAAAEPLDSIPNPRARDGTWVTDMPGALRPETIARLNATIAGFERTNGAEVAVVVVRSLDGLSIEETGVRLFERWGIGKKNRDNGLLLLWSTGDRRVRVEVGYGLEGVLPDGKVGAILNEYVMPRFRSGQFDEGLLAGVDALVAAVREEPVELQSRSASYEGGGTSVVAVVIGALSAIPVAVGSIFGFRKWRRLRRRRCPACRARMARLSEADDDARLEPGQQAEERVKSVDYDVWACSACGHHFTLRYPRWISSHTQCPQCHHRTKSSTEQVIQAASTTASGSARVLETCAFCAFRREYTKVLPRIEETSASSSHGSSGGGSSSFGGGSSGGGGASRGY
jgi:uncharacterized protein